MRTADTIKIDLDTARDRVLELEQELRDATIVAYVAFLCISDDETTRRIIPVSSELPVIEPSIELYFYFDEWESSTGEVTRSVTMAPTNDGYSDPYHSWRDDYIQLLVGGDPFTWDAIDHQLPQWDVDSTPPRLTVVAFGDRLQAEQWLETAAVGTVTSDTHD